MHQRASLVSSTEPRNSLTRLTLITELHTLGSTPHNFTQQVSSREAFVDLPVFMFLLQSLSKTASALIQLAYKQHGTPLSRLIGLQRMIWSSLEGSPTGKSQNNILYILTDPNFQTFETLYANSKVNG